jgi:hypothetical protein
MARGSVFTHRLVGPSHILAMTPSSHFIGRNGLFEMKQGSQGSCEFLALKEMHSNHAGFEIKEAVPTLRPWRG